MLSMKFIKNTPIIFIGLGIRPSEDGAHSVTLGGFGVGWFFFVI